jgi:hypothetical protein
LSEQAIKSKSKVPSDSLKLGIKGYKAFAVGKEEDNYHYEDCSFGNLGGTRLQNESVMPEGAQCAMATEY